MKLSVVIVSYNVRYFLEKCLVSVFKALDGIDGEVIVVDNNSSDQSAEMVSSRFPQVILIRNNDNRGFARASNQGLRIARGAYALLLNPDTLVSEDTFRTCLGFMETHPEASAAGVRMVDGTGTFLPESMRGLPTPLSAFFKMTGISALFPGSEFFNGYYMGGRDPDKIHRVPVLTGAFMFMRMSVLKEIGLLDEDYFMYGEDIDLCYRMVKAGYENYYLPEAIIHYKGESTHRGSFAYVKNFYNAMMIYVSKHVRGVGGSVFTLMIKFGVFARGLLGGVRRVMTFLAPVLLDAILIVAILIGVSRFWAQVYFEDAHHFDTQFFSVNLPLYAAVWLAFLFLAGAHDPQRKARHVLYGMCLGTLAILVIYAILPLEYRSSRTVILLSALLITCAAMLWTILLRGFRDRVSSHRSIGIVGSPDEVRRIMELINRAGNARTIAGWIAANERDSGEGVLGDLPQLPEIVHRHRIGELIFSTKDMSFGQINAMMSKLGPGIAYRISSSGSRHIVGSDSRKEQGILYSADVEFALAYPLHRRNKRIIDILIGIAILLCWPVIGVIYGKRGISPRRIVEVIRGRRTWIGYHPADDRISELPEIPPGVIFISTLPVLDGHGNEIHMINYIYAREYGVWKDIDSILRNFSRIIRQDE